MEPGYDSAKQHNDKKVVIGRDGRISGEMVSSLVIRHFTGIGH